MNLPDAESIAPAAVAPLPWEWFQFRTPSAPAAGILALAAASAEENAQRVWHVEVDGQPMPFKFLRPGGGAAPRPVFLFLHGMGITIASIRAISGYLFNTHDLLLPDYSGFSLTHAPLPMEASFNAIAPPLAARIVSATAIFTAWNW